MALRRNQDTPCWVRVLDTRRITVEEVEDGYHLEDAIVIIGEGLVLKVC